MDAIPVTRFEIANTRDASGDSITVSVSHLAADADPTGSGWRRWHFDTATFARFADAVGRCAVLGD